ncbi:uncharacterized protein [Argopecten irradians]|uniref:uncharacterized protein n=1 Tax=Argopecten irradians TaxID=31199 RepID=UPI0037188CA0
MNVYYSNNDPKIVGGYFLEAVKECSGTPCIIRTDHGTENGKLRDFQIFFHRNNQTRTPYIAGASTANQRIEMQNELDRTVAVWNSHHIRPSRNDQVPHGRPNSMYYTPNLWGSSDKLCQVADEDINLCTEEVTFRTAIPCDEDVYRLCIEIMRKGHIDPVDEVVSARSLYLHLRQEIASLFVVIKRAV